MKKVNIPLDRASVIFPEMVNLGNMPRKKKKMMKKNFSKLFAKKFKEWLDNGGK